MISCHNGRVKYLDLSRESNAVNSLIERCLPLEMTSITSAFNNHADEFFADIKQALPDDDDIVAAEVAVSAAKKANVTIFIKAWNKYTTPYAAQIKEKDVSFFLTKDYSSDVNGTELSAKGDVLMATIERMRIRLGTLSAENQTKVMDYVFNLTTLSMLYASQST